MSTRITRLPQTFPTAVALAVQRHGAIHRA